MADSIPNIKLVADVVVWTLAGLATICTALRLYARLVMRKNAGVEDAIVAFAALFNIATSILVHLAISSGTGTHLHDIPTDKAPGTLKLNMIAMALTIMDIMFPKLSVSILIVRILEPPRLTAALLIVAGALAILVGAATIAIGFTQCTPTSGLWDPAGATPPAAACRSPHVFTSFGIFAATCAAAVDFAFGIYPAYGFARLQMSLSKKVTVSVIMGLGVVSGAIAIYRATLIARLDQGDLTYATAALVLWSAVEANACIIAACAPALTTYRGPIAGVWTALRERGGSRVVTGPTGYEQQREEQQPVELHDAGKGDRIGLVDSGKAASVTVDEDEHKWAPPAAWITGDKLQRA